MQIERQTDKSIEADAQAQDLLASVVEEVRLHAQIEPERYLSDAIVPEGGE